MAKKATKPVEPEELIPVWVHKKGIPGYDEYGNPVKEMAVNNYGYATAVAEGMQPADTDPLHLKEYKPRTYKTRQIKAETDVADQPG